MERIKKRKKQMKQGRSDTKTKPHVRESMGEGCSLHRTPHQNWPLTPLDREINTSLPSNREGKLNSSGEGRIKLRKGGGEIPRFIAPRTGKEHPRLRLRQKVVKKLGTRPDKACR